MAACFCIEILLARPEASGSPLGVIPHINNKSLYIAIGMLGATVMPHNLYLHSALVQTRQIGHTEASKRAACRYNLVDSTVALNAALLVNCRHPDPVRRRVFPARHSDSEPTDRDGADRNGAKRSRPNSKRQHIRYPREPGSG